MFGAPTKSFDNHLRDVEILKELQSGQRSTLPRIFPFAGQVSPSHMTTPRPTADQLLRSFLRRMNAVVSVDPRRLTAWVEPGITMDSLCRYLLNFNLIPTVVPEFKGITVGGAAMGAGLESSSFLYGQFNDSCLDYELLLPGGRTLRANKNRHNTLFHGVSGSYGTLGSITLAKIQVALAKPYVKLRYRVVATQEIVEKLDELCRRAPPPKYIDAIVLSPERTVIMEASPVPEPEANGQEVVRFDPITAPWFCQHVVRRTAEIKPNEDTADIVPIYDYIFRYDRAAFWMGQFVTSRKTWWRFLLKWRIHEPTFAKDLHRCLSEAPPTLNPPLWFRTLLGPKLSSTQLYRVLHSIPLETLTSCFLVQDFYTPLLKLDLFLDHLIKNVQIYPLWLCPIRGGGAQQFLAPHSLSEEGRFPSPDFVNVGVYGIPKHSDAIPEIMRDLESVLQSMGGRKMLYSAHSYSRSEFWEIYDKQRYYELRKEYDLDSLPDIYDIVCP